MNKTCVVDGAVIDYEDTGAGPVVVFVHGVYVTGAIWHRVVTAIGGRARCIVPTWPLGAHEPVEAGVDLSAAATARRIVGFLEALDLHGVTLVANDTGGGLVLAALGDPALDTSRIGSLVFTNCDSYEHFPPGQFRVLVKLCQISPRLGSAVLRALSTKPGLSVFLKAVCKQPVTDAEKSAIFGAFLTNSADATPGGRRHRLSRSSAYVAGGSGDKSLLRSRSPLHGPPATRCSRWTTHAA